MNPEKQIHQNVLGQKNNAVINTVWAVYRNYFITSSQFKKKNIEEKVIIPSLTLMKKHIK